MRCMKNTELHIGYMGYISVDDSGFIFVANSRNHRVYSSSVMEIYLATQCTKEQKQSESHLG